MSSYSIDPLPPRPDDPVLGLDISALQLPAPVRFWLRLVGLHWVGHVQTADLGRLAANNSVAGSPSAEDISLIKEALSRLTKEQKP